MKYFLPMPSKLIKATCSFCNKEFQRGKYDIEKTLKKIWKCVL